MLLGVDCWLSSVATILTFRRDITFLSSGCHFLVVTTLMICRLDVARLSSKGHSSVVIVSFIGHPSVIQPSSRRTQLSSKRNQLSSTRHAFFVHMDSSVFLGVIMLLIYCLDIVRLTSCLVDFNHNI